MPRFALARHTALACLAVVVSSCDALTGNKAGSFTIGLSDNVVTVNQGQVDTILITVTRKDYDKDIVLTLSGVPAGVSTALSPGTLSGVNQSLLVISPAGTATLGQSTITIKANGEGLAELTESVDLTVGVTGSFTLSSQGGPARAASAAGGGDQVTVLVQRVGGHADNVAFTVSGAPTGVSATVSPPETNGRSALLSVATDATAAAGTYTLYVKGASQGLPPDSAAITLNIIAAPATASFTLPFCAADVPSWLAYKNEGFPWQRVVPTGSNFTFNATAKLGLAYTFVISGVSTNQTQLHVYYADRSEHAGQTDRDCSGPKTLTGTIAGTTTGQSARVVMGNALASPTDANRNFTLTAVADRSLDLTAVKGSIAVSVQGTLTATPDKVFLLRGLNPSSGASLGTIDFNAAEAFAPATTQLTIANQSTGDLTSVVNSLWTATSSYGLLQATQPTSSPTTLQSVPPAQFAGSDMHELVVESFQNSFSTGRVTVSYLGTLSDRTETMAPLVNAPTFNTVTTSPVRMRGQLASQAEYPAAAQFVYFQDGGSSADRLVIIAATAMFYGATPTTWDITVPDFSGIPGFSANWMLSTGETFYEVDGFAGRGVLLFQGLPTVGDVIRQAYRVDVLNAALMAGGAAARPALPLRRGRLGGQYLRR